MTVDCEYCKKSYSSKSSLKRHQLTTKACIKIQKEKGLTVNITEYKCNCGKSFNLKCNYVQHTKTCKTCKTSEIEKQKIELNKKDQEIKDMKEKIENQQNQERETLKEIIKTLSKEKSITNINNGTI